MALDPAIPPHLRCPRTQPLSTPPDYVPPVAAYCTRFPESTKDIVIAVLGVQASKLRDDALTPLLDFVKVENNHSPGFWDVAIAIDSQKFETKTVIAYWNNKKDYTEWASSSGFDSWWNTLKPKEHDNGWFKEVFFPPIERFETIFSDNVVPEGSSHMREAVSGPVLEHVYWGSARDRLPIAQVDGLEGEGRQDPASGNETAPDTTAQRIKVRGQRNLCVIRSGQDWSVTRPEEREMYLGKMNPTLEKGMFFLRDEGHEVGCYENRLMSVLDRNTLSSDTDKTFGLGYFDSLGSLEKWSKEHPTHLAIFGGFLKYVKDLGGDYTLRLWHEVMVLAPEQQDIEYIGCHSSTGLLSVGSSSWETVKT